MNRARSHSERVAPDRTARVAVTIASLVAIALLIAVFAARARSVIEAAGISPGVALTSGFEEESFYALHRIAHGGATYPDPTAVPYTASYFGWLFYEAYALPIRWVIGVHGYTALPNAGRAVTALGAGALLLVLSAVSYRIGCGTFVAAFFGCAVAFGPLVGWWALTLRPDMWGLAFETGGIAVVLLLVRNRPCTAAIIAGFLFLAAWSFKPTFLFGLFATMGFLVARRQLSAATLLTTISVLGWVLTFALRRELVGVIVPTNHQFDWPTGIANLRDALSKSAPLWIPVAALGWRFRFRELPTGIARDAALLGVLAVSTTLVLGFVASCKIGAASNYFLTLMPALALVGAAIAATFPARFPTLLATIGLTAALQAAMLCGAIGTISIVPQARALAHLWEHWHRQPEPRFSSVTALNLPWLNQASPPLVLAFNYPLARETGTSFERGGVGGMIERGDFATLLLPASTGDRYDRGSLSGYERGETIGSHSIFHRRETKR